MKNPQTLPLADEIESVLYIPLEETADEESLIGGVLGYAVTEKHIYIHPVEGGRIVLFDKQGHFVKTLIRYGQGPGEFYGTFIRMQAVEDSNLLYLYCSDRIFMYNLDGDYIKTLSHNYNSIFINRVEENRLVAVAMPYVPFQAGSFGIGIFTEDGDTIAIKKDFSSPLVSAEKTGFTIGLTPPAYSERMESVLFKTGSSDTVYRISDDKILPACILNLNNSDNEIIRSLDATDFSSLLSGNFEGNGDIYISDMFETINQYYFRFRHNGIFYVASVNKNTGSTIVEKTVQPGKLEKLGDANTLFGMIGTRSYNNFPVWGTMEGSYLVQIVTPYELEFFKHIDSITLPTALTDMGEEGNPVFILYKIKE